MKRIFSVILLSHWLLFFLLHALGALAGSLSVNTISGVSNIMSAFSAGGAIRAMPIVSEGLGTAALLVATLFFWSLLSALFGQNNEASDGEVEKIAFGGGALVFSTLSALSILDGDPTVLMASVGYLSALLLSWLAIRTEMFEAALSDTQLPKAVDTVSPSVAYAKSMASGAAHNNLLAKIAGRERI